VARLGREAEDGIDALLDQALAYESVEAPSLTGFLEWIDRADVSVKRRSDEASDQVRVMTVHGAKGLEAPIVILPDTGPRQDGRNPPQILRLAGRQPVWRMRTEQAPAVVTDAEQKRRWMVREENRRLLYVALTRARDELHCTWARSRAFGSRSLKRSPSPWLEVIGSTLGVAPSELTRAEGAKRARAARATLPPKGGPASAEDRELFEALRRWRRDTAAASDVPAFVVFNDATLTAVAERRPRSRGDLLDVPGVGPVKAERFGADLLRIVSEAG
jgi:ATP-dependent exoDNAse (exonuclease V) beta subunit